MSSNQVVAAIAPEKKEKKQEKNKPNVAKSADMRTAVYEFSKKQAGYNLTHRHAASSCYELDSIDAGLPSTERLKIERNKSDKFTCYPCGRQCRSLHPVYIFSCFACGTRFQEMRYFTRPLQGHVALVTGARSKLGHQIVLKLLRAGATVIGLTRFPDRAKTLFDGYSDCSSWSDKLHWVECDFDCNPLTPKIEALMAQIKRQFGFLSIIINNAAQTIRVREKTLLTQQHSATDEQQSGNNRYGDLKAVPVEHSNSWQQTPEQTEEAEYMECYRINALAPSIIMKTALPLLRSSVLAPFIVNVHAREGLLGVRKSQFHVHTNMAKAALHMLTSGLVEQDYKTNAGLRFQIHGCDPGWISQDEYWADKMPWPVPPLDELDGAARILFPIFAKKESCRQTRRHFYILQN